MVRDMKCTSLRQLKLRQAYKIVGVKMDDRVTILFLKEAENEEEFISLKFQDLIPLFREAVRQNNGEAAGLKLKFFGCINFGGGAPIIRISGKRFTRYLV